MSLAAETRCDREIVKNDFDGDPDPFCKALYTDIEDKTFRQNIDECTFHSGFEIGAMNTIFFKMGYLIDRLGVRYERTTGFGIRLVNHLNFDFSYIYSPEGFMDNTVWVKKGSGGSSGVRDQQTRFSFTYTSGIRVWTEDDWNWWKSR